jgi:hypothetical protein
MKKVLLALGFVLLLGGGFISCKKNCYCDFYRVETGNVINGLNVGPATAKQCKDLEGVKEVQIYTGTFHDSIVCHR